MLGWVAERHLDGGEHLAAGQHRISRHAHQRARPRAAALWRRQAQPGALRRRVRRTSPRLAASGHRRSLSGRSTCSPRRVHARCEPARIIGSVFYRPHVPGRQRTGRSSLPPLVADRFGHVIPLWVGLGPILARSRAADDARANDAGVPAVLPSILGGRSKTPGVAAAAALARTASRRRGFANGSRRCSRRGFRCLTDLAACHDAFRVRCWVWGLLARGVGRACQPPAGSVASIMSKTPRGRPAAPRRAPPRPVPVAARLLVPLCAERAGWARRLSRYRERKIPSGSYRATSRSLTPTAWQELPGRRCAARRSPCSVFIGQDPKLTRAAVRLAATEVRSERD